jgi:carbon monoxide dehydrogenase subunit G
VIGAPLAEVWKVIEDPYQMPRWWPGVERMEEVEEDRFTQVFKTRRRRTVRADFRVLASEAPGGQDTSGHRAWTQEITGTPFEPVLREAITEVALEPAERGTRVTIAQRQRLRGYSKTGALAMRSATGKRLDEALDGLERILG